MPVLFGSCGLLLAAALFVKGDAGAACATSGAFALLAVSTSPMVFPRSVGALEAETRSAVDGRPIVYWRPGCTYCLRLRLRLGRRARQVHWVDIWRDPAGAAAVRAAAAGDETVPTVVVAGRPHVNPDPGWVRRQLPPAGRR